ncbi:MAG: aminopeptidase [Candidatus Nanohaloarchaea archaeon]
MSLREGAETIVRQCLDVSTGEEVVVVDDGNDPDLVASLLQVLDETAAYSHLEYEEPENHGEEPPQAVAEAMMEADVFIAPTRKSITHTRARVDACENGARGATLPGITKEIWNTSLQADYERVKELSEKVYRMLEDTSKVTVETPSGTDLRFNVEFDSFYTDTGMAHDPGQFTNLPAGEAHGGVVNASGELVVDHMPFVPEDSEGAVLEIEDSRVTGWRNLEEDAKLARVMKEVEGARNVAEFGFGTNPGAAVIGNILQDEKVLGTVHIAIGDNTHYFPEGHHRRNGSDIHWDAVCIEPTVFFDDREVIARGEPVFLEEDF